MNDFFKGLVEIRSRVEAEANENSHYTINKFAESYGYSFGEAHREYFFRRDSPDQGENGTVVYFTRKNANTDVDGVLDKTAELHNDPDYTIAITNVNLYSRVHRIAAITKTSDNLPILLANHYNNVSVIGLVLGHSEQHIEFVEEMMKILDISPKYGIDHEKSTTLVRIDDGQLISNSEIADGMSFDAFELENTPMTPEGTEEPISNPYDESDELFNEIDEFLKKSQK